MLIPVSALWASLEWPHTLSATNIFEPPLAALQKITFDAFLAWKPFSALASCVTVLLHSRGHPGSIAG
jgi:hypothetical protein